ncbi:MAG: hypothetical protein LBC59_04140 [Chitinispirillales bacterium]|jgi:hypothetical protein|nr:hypothetical protein [Chitinispirillales bacterium]
MTTLVIDRQTLPETILSFIGSPRVLVSAESDRVVLTPVVDETGVVPEEYDIDPDDYPDTTAYLNAIPGMAESLIELMKTPLNEYEDWDD